MGVVYVIENRVNSKKYIGKTMRELEGRKMEHIYQLRSKTHYNKHLQNAWNKHGEDSFVWSVLFSSDDEVKVNEMERYYISEFSTMEQSVGYNLRAGGEGGAMSSETKIKISVSARGNGSNLSETDVRQIKLALYCLMDRKEIAKKFNTSVKVLTSIVQGRNFSYVNEDLNNKIFGLKENIIKDRNAKILEMFDSGLTISEISNKTGHSVSIVEKCIYTNRKAVSKTKNKYQKIYLDVLELKKQGLKKYHIAKQLGISPSTVDRYLNKNNNPFRELPFKKIGEDQHKSILIKYFVDNKTQRDIAEEFNVADTTIGSILNHYKYTNTEVIEEIKKSSTP